MFKRIMLFLLLVSATAALAAPVDLATSQAVAQAQLTRLGARGHTVVRCDEIRDDGRLLARAFALAPTGYVVVAADDGLPPVVAYALESSLPQTEMPGPLPQLVAADLAARLAAGDRIDAAQRARWQAEWAALADGDASPARFEQWPPAGTTPTGGWLQSTWTQSAPYNNLCPLDIAHGSARSQAGCPSVAMAMILNYYGTIQGTVLGDGDRYWHGYAGNYYYIPDAAAQYGFPTFATLNGYLQTVTDHWRAGTPLNNTDKAALVFACGVACTQVYAAAGSGTFGVSQAYDAYQRFGFTGSRLVLDSDPDLASDLAAEMQVGHLAHLAVVDAAWSVGHNLVVDGYNTDGFYHLNFGWGGSYNGWYRLLQGLPYNLTVIEGLILDIVPAATAVDAPAAAPALLLANQPNPFNPRTTVAFTAPAAGHARLAVYDLAGRLVDILLDDQVGAGQHSIAWAPAARASGVYLARLDLNGGHAMTRMVLLQ